MRFYMLLIIALIVAGCRIHVASEFPDVMTITRVETHLLTPTIEPVVVNSTSSVKAGIQVIYQPFEHGFMLWNIEKGCAYAYQEEGENRGIIIPDSLDREYSSGNHYTYCLPQPDNPRPELNLTAPDNITIPTDGIGLIWRSYPEVRDRVGFAIDESEQYISYPPYEGSAITLICCNVATLPDGRVLFCGMYGHSSGNCRVSKKEE